MRTSYRTVALLAVAVLALGGLATAPAASADSVQTILGSVQGIGYGFTVPIEGAETHLFFAQTFWPTLTYVDTGYGGTTDFSGLYAFTTDLVSPPYTGACFYVAGDAADFATAQSLVFGLSPSSLAVASIKLTVMPTQFTGTVRDSATNKRLKGVKVACCGTYVHTDAKGRFTLSGLLAQPDVKASVVFTKTGFKKVTRMVLSDPGASAAIAPFLMTRI